MGIAYRKSRLIFLEVFKSPTKGNIIVWDHLAIFFQFFLDLYTKLARL